MRRENLKAAVIGKDGRTSAIERCLLQSPRIAKPLLQFSEWQGQQATEDILRRSRDEKPDFVIVGPEQPLAEGIVDSLQKLGIPCVGPIQSLARLESSKAFTRDLLSKYHIPGNPRYQVFHSINGIHEYLDELGSYVVKPDGLTGGKGVKLSGAHLFSTNEALDYCEELLRLGHPAVVIEEKLDGEEFFCSSTMRDLVIPKP